METARDLFKAGKTLRDAGDPRGALEKFKQAHSLGNTPITGLELGKAYVAAGDLVEARDVLLSVGRLPVKPSESASAKESRVEAEKLAAEIKPRIPTVTIIVSGLGPGATATVKVDDVALNPAAVAVPLKVNPGKHVIAARDRDGAETRVEITLMEGEAKTVPLVVSPSTSAVAGTGSEAPSSVKTGVSTEEEKVAQEEREARAKGVQVTFASPEPSVQWTLRHADGFALCALPCTRWIGLKSGYYVQREGDAGSASARVTVPMNWNYSYGTNLDATIVPARGNATAAAVATAVGGVVVVIGVVMLFAEHTCNYRLQRAGESIPANVNLPGHAACDDAHPVTDSLGTQQVPLTQDSRSSLVSWSVFGLGALALGAGATWLLWSHSAHVDAVPTGRVATRKFRFGPTGFHGTF